MKLKKLPHPIPYQGSKRNLAPDILRYFPEHIDVLYEPFAGSAAMTIAAAEAELAHTFHINDLNKPLVDLWGEIIKRPDQLAAQYEKLWNDQLRYPKAFYVKVRDEFNRTGAPHLFLYLLARCVKASVRYNARGEFNQSPDNRRKGTKPQTMKMQIMGASYFLNGKTLPDELSLTLIELDAGRSSQATLLGRKDVTIESLYLSPALADELAHVPTLYRYTRGEQLCLMEGRA